MDWFDLLAVQGTLKSLLQYHCLIESILQLSAFFIVQLSHLLGQYIEIVCYIKYFFDVKPVVHSWDKIYEVILYSFSYVAGIGFVVVVQLLSCVQLFATLWAAACQASLFFTNSQSLLKLMFIELMIPSNHLILCQPLLFLPSVLPSIQVFSNELALHIRQPKYWSFSISPSNEYSGLIFFRIDWFGLLAVQGTLKSLLQHHSLKVSILWHSAFFMVQLTSIHNYWKNHSFEYMDLCQQSDVSVFSICCLGLSWLFFQGASVF